MLNVINQKIRTLLIVCICFLFIVQASAQTFELEDTQIQHEKTQRASITAILDPEPESLKKAWQDYLKDTYDVKIKGIGFLVNKDVLTAERINFEKISDKEMNLYTKVVEKDGVSEMSVFGSLGYDIYINKEKYPEMYEEMKNVFIKFLDSYLPTYYQGQIDVINEDIESLNEDLGDLEEDISDSRSEIDKMKKEIEKMESQIEKKESELASKREKLNERRERLAVINQKIKKVN